MSVLHYTHWHSKSSILVYIEGSLLEQTDPYSNVLQAGDTRKKIQRFFFRCCKNSCNLSEIRTPAIYGHTKERLFSQMSMLNFMRLHSNFTRCLYLWWNPNYYLGWKWRYSKNQPIEHLPKTQQNRFSVDQFFVMCYVIQDIFISLSAQYKD